MALGFETGNTFLWMLGLALLGGLILNVMPCVLPVLSVKLMNVVGKVGQDRQRVRLGFLVSSAGILAAFVVLAFATILAKASGALVGWGFQFQQPAFLVVLALICTAFAANLWDLFDIQPPTAIIGRVQRWMRAASLEISPPASSRRSWQRLARLPSSALPSRSRSSKDRLEFWPSLRRSVSGWHCPVWQSRRSLV